MVISVLSWRSGVGARVYVLYFEATSNQEDTKSGRLSSDMCIQDSVPRCCTSPGGCSPLFAAREYKNEDFKREDILTARAIRLVRNEKFSLIREEWRTYLARPNIAGARTVEAICPYLDAWLDKRHGNLSYRMTQTLTGASALFYLESRNLRL